MRSTVVRTDLAYSPASLPGLLPSHTNTAQAVMMLDIARGLQKVGLLDEAAKEWTKLRSRAYSSYRTVQEFYDLKEYDTVVDALRRADPDELTMAVRYLYQDAMDTTIEIRRRIELFNTVLGTDYFPAERQILEKYISILQAPASLRDPDAYAWSLDPILPEMLPQVGADKIVSSMLRELLQWIPASVADVHVSPAFARVGAGEVPEGTKQRLDSVLRGALTAVGSGSLHADGPVGEDGISRIDLAAELAAIDASQRYVIRAYIVDLYGAAHLALRLIDSREKRLVAFTAATVAALEPSFPARLR
jgi:hypothetical protein